MCFSFQNFITAALLVPSWSFLVFPALSSTCISVFPDILFKTGSSMFHCFRQHAELSEQHVGFLDASSFVLFIGTLAHTCWDYLLLFFSKHIPVLGFVIPFWWHYRLLWPKPKVTPLPFPTAIPHALVTLFFLSVSIGSQLFLPARGKRGLS